MERFTHLVGTLEGYTAQLPANALNELNEACAALPAAQRESSLSSAAGGIEGWDLERVEQNPTVRRAGSCYQGSWPVALHLTNEGGSLVVLPPYFNPGARPHWKNVSGAAWKSESLSSKHAKEFLRIYGERLSQISSRPVQSEEQGQKITSRSR